MARNFVPDREIVLFDSLAELRRRAEGLLADPAACADLAARARTRALAEHTWRHRLEWLLAESTR